MVDVHKSVATLMAVLCAVVTLGMCWALVEWLAMVHRLCVCILNYSLAISDTNECLSRNGGCAHNCSNTDGSFVCSCVSGYELGTDGMACNGT